MRKAIAVGMILALVTIVFATAPMNANAATVVKIAPKSGRPGMPVNIIGNGFNGLSNIAVKFGNVPCGTPKVLNDKTIQVDVPPRNILDANPVKVTVIGDGVPAIGDLWFTYDPAGPEPAITGFDPPTARAEAPFIITITGTDFATPHDRQPNQIFLIGPADTVEGRIIEGAADTSFAAEFLAARAGEYFILVGFTDGAGASTEGFQTQGF